jgi:hypothetical protein
VNFGVDRGSIPRDSTNYLEIFLLSFFIITDSANEAKNASASKIWTTVLVVWQCMVGSEQIPIPAEVIMIEQASEHMITAPGNSRTTLKFLDLKVKALTKIGTIKTANTTLKVHLQLIGSPESVNVSQPPIKSATVAAAKSRSKTINETALYN